MAGSSRRSPVNSCHFLPRHSPDPLRRSERSKPGQRKPEDERPVQSGTHIEMQAHTHAHKQWRCCDLASEAVPGASLLTCKSSGDRCLPANSPASPFCPVSSCLSVHAAERWRRCEQPRGAPLVPQSHLLSLSLSPPIAPHTPTCLPCSSLPIGPQSTRTKRTGGGRCPATPSRRAPWTGELGALRMKVRSPCLKTGRWPTQRQAWSTLSSEYIFLVFSRYASVTTFSAL